MTSDTIRIQHVADLISGYPFGSEDFSSEEGMPLIRIRDITAAEFSTFIDPGLVPEEATIRDGDVLVGMDGDFNVALWSRGEGALNQRVCVLRAQDWQDPRFIAYALPDKLRAINDVTYSTTVKHLSAWDI